MQDVIAVLTDTHRNMERVLMLMRFQLDSLRQQNHASAYILLGNAIGYMHRYPNLVHPPIEDLICAKLGHKLPELRPLVPPIREQPPAFPPAETPLPKDIHVARDNEGRGWRGIQEQ